MSILGRAELLLQAKNYSGSGNWLDEANSHDAVNNGALFLDGTTEQYLYLPGVAANYASTPDTAALSITGDIDIRCKVALDDWTPTAQAALVSKYVASGNQRAYRFSIATDGKPKFQFSTNGTDLVTKNSTAATSVTNGEIKWVRVTMDVDNGASGYDIKFYLSDDGVAWTQLGTTVTTSTATSINDSTSVLEVGTSDAGTANLSIGSFYQAQIYSDISETTLVFDADFTDRTLVKEPFVTFAEDSSNGATVTINRAATGVKAAVVDEDLWLVGTDDWLEVADDNGLDFAGADTTAEALTLMAMARTYDISPAGNSTIAGKKVGPTSTSAGYSLYNSTGGAIVARLADGTAKPLDTVSTAIDGTTFVAAYVRNIVDDDIEVFVNGAGSGSAATDTTTVTSANARPFHIGSDSNATPANFFDGEIMAVVLWREALTDAEVALAGKELQSYNPNSLLLWNVGA